MQAIEVGIPLIQLLAVSLSYCIINCIASLLLSYCPSIIVLWSCYLARTVSIRSHELYCMHVYYYPIRI